MTQQHPWQVQAPLVVMRGDLFVSDLEGRGVVEGAAFAHLTMFALEHLISRLGRRRTEKSQKMIRSVVHVLWICRVCVSEAAASVSPVFVLPR